MDLLKIRAKNGKGITWSFVDESMVGYRIELDQAPYAAISDGDIWQVELVSTKNDGKTRRKVATVRLVAKVRELQPWQKIQELPGFWMDPQDLQMVLIWLHTGTDIILQGHKGTGKTTFAFALAAALGWQEPYKVDVYTIKRTTDLFGSDAATKGSTHFVRSGFLDYIERAMTAHELGLPTQFIVILDEINRVHAKSNESMHGLFDDTRQVTIVTTEGSKTIRLPPNLHFMGTMNLGAQYQGIFQMDEALKDRFAAVKMRPVPIDYEVKRLVEETGILERQALAIVRVANALREAAAGGQISHSPSYRGCRDVARLVKHDVPLRLAIIKGFLGWLDGDLVLDAKGDVDTTFNTEVAKAYSALRMKGESIIKDAVADLKVAS